MSESRTQAQQERGGGVDLGEGCEGSRVATLGCGLGRGISVSAQQIIIKLEYIHFHPLIIALYSWSCLQDVCSRPLHENAEHSHHTQLGVDYSGWLARRPGMPPSSTPPPR